MENTTRRAGSLGLPGPRAQRSPTGFEDPRVTRQIAGLAGQAGFTLVELLVVIGLLGVLAVVLIPQISGARTRGEEVETLARISHLAQACDGYKRAKSRGYYPPDDFVSRDPEDGVKCKADEINGGIESAMIFLHQRAEGLQVFDDKEDWLGNTDEDSNSADIPLLQRRAKVEVLDAWGTPLAYFTNQTYGKDQKIKRADGQIIKAGAWKNPNSNGYYAPRGYQIISAGVDREFNTVDDLSHPSR